MVSAAGAGDVDRVRALLAEGANVNATTPGSQTPLMLAAINGHAEVVRLLLDAGADVQVKDRVGHNAADWARVRGFFEITELLRKYSTTRTSPPAEATPAPAIRPAEAVPTGVDVESAREQAAVRSFPPAEEAKTPEVRINQRPDAGAPTDALPNIAALEESHEAKTEWLGAAPAVLADEDSTVDAPISEVRAVEEPRGEVEAVSDILLDESSDISVPENIEPYSSVLVPTDIEPHLNETPDDATSPVLSVSGDERSQTEQEHEPDEVPQITLASDTTPALVETQKRDEVEARPIIRRETLGLSTAADEPIPVSPKPLGTLGLTSTAKRCPKCNATYTGDVCTDCARREASVHAEPSISATHPSVISRPLVWVLMTVALLGGVLIGYGLNRFVSRTTEEKPAPTIAATPVTPPVDVKPDGPVVGGSLAGAQVDLPPAEYPAKARNEGVSGSIVVRVRVNKKGRVVSARSSSGNWRLRAAAVQAAKKTTFAPEKLSGKAASGTITYTFKS